jgi:hypothetical protein
MYLTTMDKETILNSINSDISAFVSDKFTDYISLKVKEEVEKEKALFLEGLNVSQEEFPVFDEEKHEHFKGIKIVNDPDIPVQMESARKYELLDTEDEFILSGIKIDKESLDITTETLTRFEYDTCEFFITNKGNIYNKTGHAKCGCVHPQLFNYKAIEFIQISRCSSAELISHNHVEVKRGCPIRRWRSAFVLPTDDEYLKVLNGEFKDSNGHDIRELRKGCGCKYNVMLPDTDPYWWQGEHLVSKRPSTLLIDNNKNHYGFSTYGSSAGSLEDSIERFMKNDICKECSSGRELENSMSEENKTINPEILRNPPMFNNEYIEILTLLSKKNFTIPIYQFQTIYAKYHPRANENSLMETKIKHLSDIENRVTDAVKTERDILTKQIEDYENKHTILQNDIEKMSSDKENFQKDILALKVMNKHAEEKLRQKSIEKNNHYNKWAQDVKLKLDDREKQLNDKALKLDENTDESKEYLQKLLKIALVINEANDKIDDKFSISDDLFSIVRELNTMVENENVLPTSFDKIAGYIEPKVEPKVEPKATISSKSNKNKKLKKSKKIHSKAIQEYEVVASLKTSNNWLDSDSDDDILDSD